MGAVGLWRWSGEAQERRRLVERVAQPVKASIERDQVEKIAMLAGGGVGPLAGGALAGGGPLQPDEKAAARCVPDVADEPIARPSRRPFKR